VSATPYGPGVPLVIDSSAWHRQGEAGVSERWKATAKSGLLVSCPGAALEILSGAPNERAFEIVDEALGALPQAPITVSASNAAIGACRELGARRRIPAADYLIAAAAAERGFGVLHQDRHFDLLAKVLEFESVRMKADD
jgi:predicted nucleic acid-binding protein